MPVCGHDFLTGDNNLDYITHCHLQFDVINCRPKVDAVNCRPKVQVGPRSTTACTIGGHDIWNTIPALVLRKALEGLIDVGVEGNKAFIIQEMNRWDLKYFGQHVVHLEKHVSKFKEEQLVVGLGNTQGTVAYVPFYAFLDSLNAPFHIDFKSAESESIGPNWICDRAYFQSIRGSGHH